MQEREEGLTCGRASLICHSYTEPSAAVNRSGLSMSRTPRLINDVPNTHCAERRKRDVRGIDARLGHVDGARADDELCVVVWKDGPLDDADLEAVAGWVGACDGGGGATAVA